MKTYHGIRSIGTADPSYVTVTGDDGVPVRSRRLGTATLTGALTRAVAIAFNASRSNSARTTSHVFCSPTQRATKPLPANIVRPSRLSVNTTNAKILVRAFGPESESWIGKKIKLVLGTIDFRGEPQESVIVEPPKSDMDDAIPF
jgi:hypothetical protein